LSAPQPVIGIVNSTTLDTACDRFFIEFPIPQMTGDSLKRPSSSGTVFSMSSVVGWAISTILPLLAIDTARMTIENVFLDPQGDEQYESFIVSFRNLDVNHHHQK
jgi:hypothetical protein